MLHVKILHPRAPLPLKCRTIVNISKFASEAAYTSSKLSSLFKLKPSTLVYNSSCSQISSKKFFTSTVFKSIIKWNKKAIQLPSKDTIIYSYSTHLRKIAFLGALFQISFWMNLSHFCFTELQYEGHLASLAQRCSASMFVITIGGIIIHMMNVYLRTRVSSIILLKDQKHCQIKTLSLFGNFQRPMLLENIKTDSLHSLDMSNEFSMVLKKAGAGPINIEELAASMKSEDVNKLMNTGSLKLDVKGLKYKLDVDKSGDFSDINLFNTLFDKKY